MVADAGSADQLCERAARRTAAPRHDDRTAVAGRRSIWADSRAGRSARGGGGNANRMGDRQTVRRCALLCLAIGVLHAADYDPWEVLARVRAKASLSAERAPNYTCVETVKRDFYRPVAATLHRPCAGILAQREHPSPDMAL